MAVDSPRIVHKSSMTGSWVLCVYVWFVD